MAGKRCTFYANGVHHFVFYGKKYAQCRCGHKLKRV